MTDTSGQVTTDAVAEHVEFTYDWYGEFLDELLDHGYQFQTYDQPVTDGDVLLRHDVDWSPRNALELARMEASRDVTATYFFLVTSPLYNLLHKPVRLVVEELEALGHDVGLHFSTHQHFTGEPDADLLADCVQDERTALEQVCSDPTDAVSFHRPPEWVFRRSYDGFTSTYERRFFEEITYRGDSNQRWREAHPLADGLPSKMQVLVHPGLWGELDAGFVERFRENVDSRLARTARFLDEQFVEKRYNIDDYCQHVEG
jgi:peptidoglycan/xylan/chitin deacetylase (PgdA/CDA1 family)